MGRSSATTSRRRRVAESLPVVLLFPLSSLRWRRRRHEAPSRLSLSLGEAPSLSCLPPLRSDGGKASVFWGKFSFLLLSVVFALVGSRPHHLSLFWQKKASSLRVAAGCCPQFCWSRKASALLVLGKDARHPCTSCQAICFCRRPYPCRQTGSSYVDEEGRIGRAVWPQEECVGRGPLLLSLFLFLSFFSRRLLFLPRLPCERSEEMERGLVVFLFFERLGAVKSA